MEKLNVSAKTLSKFSLFAGFKTQEIEVFLGLAEQICVEAGGMIIHEGVKEDCMYILLEGEVAVTRLEGREIEIARIGSGNCFGEIALVDDGPRSANVFAVTDCNLLRIDRSTVAVLAGVQPGAAIHLLAGIGRSLVGLLRQTNEKYLDLILSGT